MRDARCEMRVKAQLSCVAIFMAIVTVLLRQSARHRASWCLLSACLHARTYNQPRVPPLARLLRPPATPRTLFAHSAFGYRIGDVSARIARMHSTASAPCRPFCSICRISDFRLLDLGCRKSEGANAWLASRILTRYVCSHSLDLLRNKLICHSLVSIIVWPKLGELAPSPSIPALHP
jgi:hypothetical protein